MGWGILAFLILYALHEIGHLTAALIFKLKIEKIGFSMIPLPHVYIIVTNVPNKIVEYIFLFSGSFVTISIFIISFFLSLLHYNFIYYPLASLIVIELNPFYSDITLAVNNPNYKNTYMWYFHFFMWVFLEFFLYAPNMLKSFIL